MSKQNPIRRHPARKIPDFSDRLLAVGERPVLAQSCRSLLVFARLNHPQAVESE